MFCIGAVPVFVYVSDLHVVMISLELEHSTEKQKSWHEYMSRKLF